MRQVKISRWLASIVVCSLLLAAGCTPTGKEAAKPEVKVEKQISKATKMSFEIKPSAKKKAVTKKTVDKIKGTRIKSTKK